MKNKMKLTDYMGSSEEQPSGMKEKTVTLRANKIKKSLDYTKLENPLYVKQSEEKHMVDKDDDGLVKHMRNLPEYLQRVEKGENTQGNALNFGVLDWGRLENWKSNEKRIPPKYNRTNLESGSARFSRNRKKIHPPRKDKQESTSYSPLKSSSPSPGIRWPKGNALKVLISQTSEQEREANAKANANESYFYSPMEFDPVSPFTNVPHSCPFPLPLNPDPESPVTPSKKSDLETYEHSAGKGRQPSPIRRFSFSLGKMTRSFSFKESSGVPQLSPSYTSVKSGPVTFDFSPDSDKWKKHSAANQSRSSPLRRLLDPLLKFKGGGLIQKSKFDVIENESVHNHTPINVQALLQLTVKNGIPFFKLVVESSSDILAAAVKKLPSGKDDTSLIYAFYSVHENKKKSGSWMNSKEKSCRFGYTIVGQMKISSSYHAEFTGPEKNLYVVRESVLYSTDSVEADQNLLNCMVDREVSAVIVKHPSDESGGDIGRSKGTVVVLPDGVHSLPNSGLPSPLINRWRSGGACDCGGWDVGCQFRVLGHENDTAKAPSPSPSNRLELCYQGGGRSKKNKGRFSLVSVDEGLYTVEYDPSMSMLQAFSICVAVVSSQKLTHIFQVEVTGKYVSKPPASPVGRV